MTLRFPVRLLLALTVLLTWIGCAAYADPVGDADPVVHINTAEMVCLLDSVSSEFVSTLSSVDLPDTWAMHGLPTYGQAHYHVSFDLANVPQQMWALQASAMSGNHYVRLNDHVVSGEPVQARGLDRSQPGPQMVLLPPALLKAGPNHLDIEVSYGSLGGLSTIQIGPAEALEVAHSNNRFYRYTLPVTLNVASVLICLLMISLRWHYPNETLVGMIGMLWCIGSVRNLLEFTLQGLPKNGWTDWLNFSLQVGSLTLICVGCDLVAKGALKAWLRPIYALAAVVTIGCAVAIPLEAYTPLKTLCLALMFPIATTMWMTSLRHVHWSTQRTRPAMAVGTGLVLITALHDFIHRTGLISMDQQVWLHLGLPLGLSVVTWALLSRTLRALVRARDVTAELEKRVEQRTDALAQANAAKTRFLASASHDLRQPVVTIGLLVGLLRDQLSEQRHQLMIDRVDQAVIAMEDLLKGLLDLSRLDAGTVTPRRQRVMLQKLFDAITAHEGETSRLKGLKLRFHPTQMAVTSDPVLLEQILRNLVSNALRYTDYGGVLVGCRRRGDKVWIEIWDTGRGIPRDQQAQVFEEFVQLDNQARDRTRGLGLGLAIVSRSARLLGHRLALKSEPGRGSRFSLEVPYTASVPMTANPTVTLDKPLRNVRVAVIEDEAGVRLALTDRLTYWGATVTSFDGQLAMEAHVSQQDGRWTDLIVSDQRLPDGAGSDVIDWIRHHQGPTPAVLVTGNTDPDDLVAMNRRGVPVLHKPFRAEALLHCIRQAMQQGTGTEKGA